MGEDKYFAFSSNHPIINTTSMLILREEKRVSTDETINH